MITNTPVAVWAVSLRSRDVVVGIGDAVGCGPRNQRPLVGRDSGRSNRRRRIQAHSPALRLAALRLARPGSAAGELARVGSAAAGLARVGLAAAALGTFSFGTVRLGTVSFGTVSFGTVSFGTWCHRSRRRAWQATRGAPAGRTDLSRYPPRSPRPAV